MTTETPAPAAPGPPAGVAEPVAAAPAAPAAGAGAGQGADPGADLGAGEGAPAGDKRRDRYIADVLAVHDRLSLRGLVGRVDPLYLARRPGGMTVVAVPQSRLPERYQLAVYGFRLAQYLRARFASDRIAYSRALFAEPHPEGHGEEIHVIGLDEESGAILRYVSAIGTADTEPRLLTDPGRARFPVEVAHGLDLFRHVRPDEAATVDEVWEIKRLMQRDSAREASGVERMRMSLQLMLGFYSALRALQPQGRYLVGDGEEGLAIRRLTRSLKDVTVIEGTRPSLPHDDLLFPAYVQRPVVKPFVARIPRGEELSELVQWLRTALGADDPLAGFVQLVSRVESTVRRVRI